MSTQPTLAGTTGTSNNASSTHPKIAIIGAGPGGLTLARLLHLQDVPFTLYDREGGPAERNQGGTLDLHPGSGQLALKVAGLYEEFTKRARFEGDCLKLVTANGTVLLDEGNKQQGGQEYSGDPRGPPERPEIDRCQLREMLLNSLKEGSVYWGHKLCKVQAHPPVTDDGNETYTLHFTYSGEDIIQGPFDIVIGADGARSNVRPLLSTEKPFYSGISMVELWALDVDNRNPWLSKYVGSGSVFMYDQGRAIFAQRNGNGSIRVYVCVQQPESWFDDCGIDWNSSAKAREQLVDGYFSDCADDIKRLILDSCDEVVLRRLDMLPIGITWEHRGGLTLLGDAAHLMTPFAGEGVNSAMHDALELADAIIHALKLGRGLDGISEEIALYEKVMFTRSQEKAQETWNSLSGACFVKDGAETFLKMLASKGRGGTLVQR
ncbi:FAD/NAD(P)-binding domain-containing protein [Terfezia boudieri ATCC MYA-4762]|uniref:FAD/NAD(P)-binding domain-containing protein n=1 Tax=Terfezia boudieri ATCC MYA-4762 TaxID=1051890 RepID=A0A3N4LVG2_9PEZI|nr:FAD/NAD(P)-binding domain-containing protein [Terfezia boudieri ATCC MYA-4762]